MASITKRPDSPYWIACFTAADGRQLKRSTKLTDKDKAMQVAADFETAARGQMSVRQAQIVLSGLMTGHGLDAPVCSTRVWMERWVSRKKREVAEHTHLVYGSIVAQFLKWLGAKADHPMSFITAQMLSDFRENLLAGNRRFRTVNIKMTVLGVAFRAAFRERHISENPFEFVQPLKNREQDPGRKPLGVKQIKALLQVSGPEWRSMILFGVYTGQRLMDIAQLRWDAIDMTAKTIQLKTQKTRRFLKLPIQEDLYRHLVKWGEFRTSEFVHPRLSGIPRSSILGAEFAQILIDAGLRNTEIKQPGRLRRQFTYSFHSLRHTATTWLKDSGVPVSVVMDFIGHSSETMSRLYTHTGDEALKKAADSMPSLNG